MKPILTNAKTDQTLRQITSRVAVPVYDAVGPTLAKAIQDHNLACEPVCSDLRSVADKIESLIDKAYEHEVGATFSVLEGERMRRPDLLQQLIQLWEERAQICERIADEVGKKFEKADAQKPVVLAEVIDDLESIGQGLEATVAGSLGTNGAAAQAQLEFTAKHNLRYRQVAAAAQDLTAVQQAATDEARFSRERKQQATEYLRDVVRKMAVHY